MQDAVRQLDQAPFVQLVYAERAERIETHHVPRTATGAAEVSVSLELIQPLCLLFILQVLKLSAHAVCGQLLHHR